MEKQRRWLDSEHGGIRFGPIVMMILIVVGAYVAYKLVPPKVAYYKFADTVAEQVKFAGGRQGNADSIRDTLVARARELEIPLRAEDVVVNLTPNHITITAQWAVDVDLLGYKKHWVMDIRRDGPIFD